MELNSDVVNLISCATQERLRGLLEKLTVIAQHRVSTHKVKEIISKFCTKFCCFAALKVNLFKCGHITGNICVLSIYQELVSAVSSPACNCSISLVGQVLLNPSIRLNACVYSLP